MSKKNSRQDLIDSWEDTNLPDNTDREITPVKSRQANTDLFDTALPQYIIVASETARDALTLGNDYASSGFKEGDYCKVTTDDENLTSLWRYLKLASSGTWGWQLVGYLNTPSF